MGKFLDTVTCQVENGSLRGSGVLIAPNLVLTALHVVLGDNPPDRVPADMKVRVRPWQDIVDTAKTVPDVYGTGAITTAWLEHGSTVPWREGTLIWPTQDTDAHGIDCAVLELDELVVYTPRSLPGKLERETSCIAGGFPMMETKTDAARRIDLREIYQLEAIASPSQVTRAYTRTIRIEVSSETPADPDGWKGISGAGIWDDEAEPPRLLGVLHDRLGTTHANDVLSYWPLDTIADTTFWAACNWPTPGVSSATDSALREADLRTARQKFITFDRTLAATAFDNWLTGDPVDGTQPRFGRNGPPDRPAVLVVTGHEVDDIASCIDRFAHSIQARSSLLPMVELYETPITLHCGDIHTHVDDRISAVLGKWAARLKRGEGSEGLSDTDTILSFLRAADKPRAAVLEHDAEAITDECQSVLRAALQTLRAAANSDTPPSPPPILFLCITTGSQKGLEEEAYLPASAFPGKPSGLKNAIDALVEEFPEIEWYAGLPALDGVRCRQTDFDTWIEDLRDIDGIAISDDIGLRIKDRIDVFPKFPMRFAKQVLRSAFSDGARG